MIYFTIAHKNFKNSFEAQASAFTGGSLATRKVKNYSFDNMEDAIEEATELCTSSSKYNRLVICQCDESFYDLKYNEVSEVYWDSVHHMIGIVRYPLNIAA
tara:strand:+ start:1090 stop:1392 length:303 start_codon:yes stop_codon:yes gene_type:complete